MPNKAVLLVGGEGTRLRPLTWKTPKAMVPILNKPFLEHFIAYLRKHGIEDIVLALCYLPDRIKEYFGDGSAFGVHLAYVNEESPLGTAGAVRNAIEHIDGTVFVFNGDIFTDLDLSAMLAFHRKKKAIATIALTPVEDPSRFGVVETDPGRRVKAFIEKPRREDATTNMVNAGTYILAPEALEGIPPGKHYMFERGLFPQLLKDGKPVYAYPSDAYWIDIGTPENYHRLQLDLIMRKASTSLAGPLHHKESSVHADSRIEGEVVIGEGCVVGPGARIKGPAVLGPDCVIGEGAVVEQAVLWKNVSVGAGGRLDRCVVGADCKIGDGCRLEEGCVLGDACILGTDARVKKGNRLGPGTTVTAG